MSAVSPGLCHDRSKRMVTVQTPDSIYQRYTVVQTTRPTARVMESFDQVTQLQTESERRWVAFEKKLAPFPHFFQLKDQELVNINTLRDVKNHLEPALKVGFKTEFETAQALNLVAYVQFRLGQSTQALETTDRALNMEAGQDENLVSLANKAAILCHMERTTEAEMLVHILQEHKQNKKDFAYMVVKANAEIASCYTRFGPRFTQRAVDIYREVIPHGREPEVWAWKYGYALTLRHALSLQHTPVVGGEDSKGKHLSVLSLFQYITDNCQCNNSKAKAYVEIALLLDALVDLDTRKALLDAAGMTKLEACEQALQLDDSDASILSKTANIYRHAHEHTRALELLERANKLQPTSRGYHYLGLTYKALAARSKEHQENHEQNVDQTSDRKTHEETGKGNETLSSTASDAPEEGDSKPDCERKEESPGAQFLLPEHARGTMDDLTKCLVSRVKSFPQGACSTEFSRSDKYVKETMDNLSLAVDFSSRMNSRAMYDLAMIHKALGEFDRSIALLEEICGNKFSASSLDLVTAYEQRGLILRTTAEKEEDAEKRRSLETEAERMLYTALSKASRLYSRTPQVRERLGDIFHSFSTLLKSVNESSRCQQDKLREKANLLRLISKHKESLSLLQEIVQLAPGQENDPKYLKLMIENLVEEQRYSEALFFIELLQCTQQGGQTMDLFDDSHYVLKVYVKAASDALLQGKTAKHFFNTAFLDSPSKTPVTVSSCSDSTDASEDEDSSYMEQQDILVLHDDDTTEKAEKLSEVLRDVCGLTVSRMDEHVPLGKLRVEGVLRVIRYSHVVVILTGQSKQMTRELRLYIDNAAKRPSTVTLKAGGNDVPRALKARRAFSCPAELWQISVKTGERLKETEVSAVCEVFNFLASVKADLENGT